MRVYLLPPFASVLFLVACGGQTSTAPAGDAAPANDGTTSDSPASDTPMPDTPSASGCPTANPSNGAACAPVGATCEYGEDPRESCRSHATCASSGWQIAVSGCEPPDPSGACPATASQATGSCTADGAICTYDGGVVCACGNCVGGLCSTDKRWGCSSPQTNGACPATMPDVGQPCSPEGTECVYGLCSTPTNAGRSCVNGVWAAEGIACPA